MMTTDLCGKDLLAEPCQRVVPPPDLILSFQEMLSGVFYVLRWVE